MADQPKHICAGISHDNVGSDLCYELNSGETTPKDLREFLHAEVREHPQRQALTQPYSLDRKRQWLTNRSTSALASIPVDVAIKRSKS